MKPVEIRALSDDEIPARLKEIKQKYLQSKLVHSVSPLENPVQLRKQRKIIARLATELTVREKTKK